MERDRKAQKNLDYLMEKDRIDRKVTRILWAIGAGIVGYIVWDRVRE